MSQIQQVKDAHNIVDVISARVPLQVAGAYHKGLCPFHAEKSPSFFVNEQLQRFKCFGCGQGGDVFEFLQQYDSMTFAEALETLADQAGITLQREYRTQADDERGVLLEILDLARQYYHYLLTEHKAGAAAREYLQQRGMSAESIKLFQLGFALPKWDGLIAFLHRKKKHPLPLLVKAGLVISGRNSKYYDRFRGRIMFPLRNHRGQIVGFSGRVLAGGASADQQEAKYINTPETSLYHKGKLLYGYSELHQFIRAAKEVIVTEGEFDVISSAQAHVNTVVAIKGSAFTADHGQLLKRTVDTVILALDADAAGAEATKRALAVLRPLDLELRVILMPEGKDPDDLARSDAKLWKKLVKGAVSAYDFLLQMSVRQHGVATAPSKRKVIKDMAGLLWQIESKVEQEVYVKKLAEVVGAPLDTVRADVRHFATKQAARMQVSDAPASPTAPTQQLSRQEQLEQYAVCLLMQLEEAKFAQALTELGAVAVASSPLHELVQAWRDHEPPPPTRSQLIHSLAGDIQQRIMELSVDERFIKHVQPSQVWHEWTQTLVALKPEAQRHQRQLLSNELTKLEQLEHKTPQQTARVEEILHLLSS